MRYFVVFFMGFLSSCNFVSVSQAHTEGQATDVIDETATNAPEVTTDIQVPVDLD